MASPNRRELVAAEVRAELARQRMTTTGLSQVTGIPLSTLRRRLIGQSPFTLDEIELVAQALNVRAADLFDTRPVQASA